jgi:uncharacterized membrane protein
MMYPPSSSQRPRGFSPFFRTPYADQHQHIRVSDAERQEVADRLAEHYASGRLDQAEFDDRVGRAMGAKTRADLSGLFADLPDTGAPAAPELVRCGRRRRHPVLLLALIVALIAVATHVVWWFFVPWLWISIAAVAVLFLTGTLGRHRARQDQDPNGPARY